MRVIIRELLLLQSIRKDSGAVNHLYVFPNVNDLVTFVNALPIVGYARDWTMFRYAHTPRRFGHRQRSVAVADTASNMRFFFTAYVAGSAFALAYIF